MRLFHILTFIISISIFIGLFIYTFIEFNKKNMLYPPDMANCPDYWKVNPTGSCQIPKKGELNLGNLESKGRQIYTYENIMNIPNYSYLPSYYDSTNDEVYYGNIESNLPLGYYNSDIPYGYDDSKPQSGYVDFEDSGWASYGDPYCEIKKWAKINNIQWDGMANYNKC